MALLQPNKMQMNSQIFTARSEDGVASAPVTHSKGGLIYLNMTNETWLPVNGYEGFYEISSFGNCRSIDRIVPDSRNGSRKLNGRPLKLNVASNGYTVVTLTRNSKTEWLLVHRVVAEAFLFKQPHHTEVDHKDGNKQNNAVTNLEWVTTQENRDRAWALGLYKSPKGEQMPTAKLSETQVLEIRRIYPAINSNQSEIARQFGVKSSTINSIIRRNSWKHI